MIEFIGQFKSIPYKKLKSFYDEAKLKNQHSIEALCLSTSHNNKPSSRYVNIKYIKDNELVFFSNYHSRKGKEIDKNSNFAAIFFWNFIGVQIRLEGNIQRISPSESDAHFKKREINKNILAISSNQSCIIDSYEAVKEKYKTVKNKFKNKPNYGIKRPKYWGGYSLRPNKIEFWESHKNRLNKRHMFEFIHKDNKWIDYFLEP